MKILGYENTYSHTEPLLRVLKKKTFHSYPLPRVEHPFVPALDRLPRRLRLVDHTPDSHIAERQDHHWQ